MLVVGGLAAEALFPDQAAVLIIALGDGVAACAIGFAQGVVGVVFPRQGAAEEPAAAVRVGQAIAEFVIGEGFVGQAAGVADLGQTVEGVVAVTLVAVLGGLPGDIRFGVVAVGVVEQRALRRVGEFDPGRAQQAVVVAALDAAAGVGGFTGGAGGAADVGERAGET